jgi:hypothetical protein
MVSIEFYERDTVIKRIKDNLNQINQRYFAGNHGILSVTDNGDYVTVPSRTGNRHFGVQNIFDALNNFSPDGFDDLDYYDIWDYLDFCTYTLPEDQKSDNKLKTNDELSLSEKRQVALVDMLLSEPVPVPITESSSLNELVEKLEQKNKRLEESVKLLAFAKENDYQECLKYITSEKTRLNKWIKQLQEEYQELEKNYEILRGKNRELEQNKEYSQTWIDNLKQRVHDLECAIYLFQQENKRLKSNQLEKSELKPIEIQKEEQSIIDFRNTGIFPKPVIEQKPKPEHKPKAKKRPTFKLPENFADYQQECDDLINALSCFYNISKGKWNEDILQFILTPNASQKDSYPDKWKAGLYLQPGQWIIEKVNQCHPDSWQEWFMDIYEYADANDIEIS